MKKFISVFTSAALTICSVMSAGSQALASFLYNDGADCSDVRCVVKLLEDPLCKNETAIKEGVDKYILTDEGKAEYASIMEEHEFAIEQISNLTGENVYSEYDYTAAFNGFSVVLSYKDYKQVKSNRTSLGISGIEVTEYIGSSSETAEKKNTAETYSYSKTDLSQRIMNSIGTTDTDYKGDQMVIAVIDSAFDLKHEYLTMPEGVTGRLSKDDVSAISKYTSASSAGGKNFYYSEKIPFAFNYYDKTNDTLKTFDDHGTHVAGIAAGNASAVTNSSYAPQGIAPDAQLALMSAYDFEESKLLAAYDDCMFIGADVINASYGATGTTNYDNVLTSEAISNLNDSGIVFCVAAGNDGKNENTGLLDYSTGGYPTNIISALSVGSAENYFQYIISVKVGDNSYELIGDLSDTTDMTNISNALNGKTLEYVPVPGTGTESDYEGIDVNGKVALVARGEIEFEEKAENAAANGAVGIIFYNTQGNNENIDIVCETLPAGLVSYDDGQKMIAENNKKVYISNKSEIALKYDKNVMSDFSSWDFTENLMLKPDITGFGGKIVSSIPTEGTNKKHNEYAIYSGTSMSTPQLTGLMALLKQHIQSNAEKYGITSDADYTELMAKLIMSTATPVYSSDGLELASPRVQGNGLANISDAVNSPCYISSNSKADNYRPKISLGQDKSGDYTLEFNIHNISDTAQTYYLSEAVFCDSLDQNGNLNWDTNRLSAGSEYTIKFTSTDYGTTLDSVTVEPGSTFAVTAQITLSGAYDKIRNEFENGTFVDGYIMLNSDSAQNLTLSFMAFCGDWSEGNKAELFHPFIYSNPDDDYGSYLSDGSNIAGSNILGALNSAETDDKVDLNKFISQPYFSPLTDSETDSDDTVFNELFINFVSKRRCYDVTATIYNKDKQIVYKDIIGNGVTNIDLLSGEPAYNIYDIDWDFRDLDGEIHNNETYTLWITARTPLSDSNSRYPISQEFKIDTEKPIVNSYEVLDIAGDKYLMINASDNGTLQGGISYSDNSGSQLSMIDSCGLAGKSAKEPVILQLPENTNQGYAEIYDMAGNSEKLYFSDINTSDVYTLKSKGDAYFTSDEKTFKNKFAFVDSSGNTAKISFDFSDTPQSVYEQKGDSATLLINGTRVADIAVEVGLRGDANLSGKVDVRDASLIASMLARKTSSQYAEFMSSLGGYCADYNQDGKTNVRDAAAIAAFLASQYRH